MSQNALRLKLSKNPGSSSYDDTFPLAGNTSVTTALAEQLTNAIHAESVMREMELLATTIDNDCEFGAAPIMREQLDMAGAAPISGRVHEQCQLEMDGLRNRLECVKSEKYVLMLNLEEAKDEAGEFALLVPQFEANVCVLKRALSTRYVLGFFLVILWESGGFWGVL